MANEEGKKKRKRFFFSILWGLGGGVAGLIVKQEGVSMVLGVRLTIIVTVLNPYLQRGDFTTYWSAIRLQLLVWSHV